MSSYIQSALFFDFRERVPVDWQPESHRAILSEMDLQFFRRIFFGTIARSREAGLITALTTFHHDDICSHTT
jgi:hypothetical protein